jgi:type IV secretion system protein VirB4
MPWLDFVAPGVALHDDNQSLQATIALTGPDLRRQPEEVQAAAMLQVDNALQQLEWGWSLHSETLRLDVPRPAPVTTWQDPLAAAIATEHEDRLFSAPLLESCHFATLRYTPPSRSVAWLESKVYRTGEAEKARADGPLWLSYLPAFQAMVGHMASLLRGVMVDVTVLDDQATWDYLGSSLNLCWWHERIPDDTHHLAQQVDDTAPGEMIPGDRLNIRGRYIRTVSLQRLPHLSVALMLASLNDLGIPFSWTERWIPFQDEDADKRLKELYRTHVFHKKSQIWRLADKYFGEAEGGEDPMAGYGATQVQDARVFIGTRQGRLGKVTVSITVWDEDWARSEEKIQAVHSALVATGLRPKIESTNVMGAFFGSRPGLVQPNPRKPIVHSVTGTHLLAIDAVYSGPPSNPHWPCGPLFVARTARSSPYRYVPHPAKDAGAHTFFDGPQGRGKSYWKDKVRLACQQVEGIQDIGFDYKGSSKVTTWLLGGQFDDLGKGDVILQPYRHVDVPSEAEWATDWTLRWLEDLRVPIDPYSYRMVRSVIDKLGHLEPSARTISGFLNVLATPHERQQIQFHKVDEDKLHAIEQQRDAIRVALQPFRGGILDGAHEGLVLQPVHTFELETLMQAPTLCRTVLRVVDHVVRQALDGRPTILWYDELHAWLDLVESVESLNQLLRVARDKNVMILAGTQNNEDILNHKLGPSFLNNCENFVFFPNPKALSAENVKTYTAFGLTDREIQALARAIPRRQWLHVSSLGTRLVEHVGGPLEVKVCGRSGKAWHAVADRIMAEVGPEGFREAWLRLEGNRAEDHLGAGVGHVLAGV